MGRQYSMLSVKDTENILDYNIWSGGDYLKNTNGFTIANGSLARTTNYSSNGESSIYLLRLQGNSYVSFSVPLSDSDIGKTITFKVDVYSPNDSAQLQISHNSQYESSTCNSNSEFQTITLSRTIVNSDSLYCIIKLNEIDCYIDNLSITIQ